MIRVICTGKGSHREVFFKSFNLVRVSKGSGDPTVYDEWFEKTRFRPLKPSYTFGCRRCRRNPEMKAATLRRALSGLHAAGESKLDVSQLPY